MSSSRQKFDCYALTIFPFFSHGAFSHVEDEEVDSHHRYPPPWRSLKLCHTYANFEQLHSVVRNFKNWNYKSLPSYRSAPFPIMIFYIIQKCIMFVVYVSVLLYTVSRSDVFFNPAARPLHYTKLTIFLKLELQSRLESIVLETDLSNINILCSCLNAIYVSC